MVELPIGAMIVAGIICSAFECTGIAAAGLVIGTGLAVFGTYCHYSNEEEVSSDDK